MNKKKKKKPLTLLSALYHVRQGNFIENVSKRGLKKLNYNEWAKLFFTIKSV